MVCQGKSLTTSGNTTIWAKKASDSQFRISARRTKSVSEGLSKRSTKPITTSLTNSPWHCVRSTRWKIHKTQYAIVICKPLNHWCISSRPFPTHTIFSCAAKRFCRELNESMNQIYCAKRCSSRVSILNLWNPMSMVFVWGALLMAEGELDWSVFWCCSWNSTTSVAHHFSQETRKGWNRRYRWSMW